MRRDLGAATRPASMGEHFRRTRAARSPGTHSACLSPRSRNLPAFSLVYVAYEGAANSSISPIGSGRWTTERRERVDRTLREPMWLSRPDCEDSERWMGPSILVLYQVDPGRSHRTGPNRLRYAPAWRTAASKAAGESRMLGSTRVRWLPTCDEAKKNVACASLAFSISRISSVCPESGPSSNVKATAFSLV